MRKSFCFLSLWLLLLSACSPGGGGGTTYLPDPTGGIDELMIVVPQHLQDAPIGDTIEQYFEAAYPSLPQPEPRMAASMVRAEELNALLKRFRNTLFIGYLEDQSPTGAMIRELLGDQFTEDKEVLFLRKTALWANDQIVFFLVTRSKEQLDEAFQKHKRQIRNSFEEREWNRYRDIAMVPGENVQFGASLSKNWGFKLSVPMDFKVAKKEGSFIWLRNDEAEAIQNLMIQVFDLSEASFGNSGPQIRNDIGKRFVQSDVAGAYMSTDTMAGLKVREFELDGLSCWENRGLWKMVGDFKGGPFVQYYIHDEANKRAIFIEGNVFAPAKKKKPHIKTLESILRSFKKG